MTLVDERLALAHRQQTIALRARTMRDTARLWPLLNQRRMDATFPDWLAMHSTLIRRDNRQAAALAANYLKAARLSSGVSGEAVIRIADGLPVDQIEASMSTTARAGFYKALRSGRTVEEASRVALVRTLGSTSRLVLQGSRDTVRTSLAADRVGRGWQRIAAGSACAFCKMLAGRGAIYRAETADFAAHDHCSCSVAAVYSAEPVAVRDYEPSTRGRWSDRATEGDRARMTDALSGVA